MIHSRHKDPEEIIEFMHRFRSIDSVTPVVVVPTSFNSVTIEEFMDMGVNIVITANHMLRAAYPAMLNVAKSILENGRSLEAEPDCMPVKEILDFIPGTK
jgi:phosphoenolpyruvate phosphomutase